MTSPGCSTATDVFGSTKSPKGIKPKAIYDEHRMQYGHGCIWEQNQIFLRSLNMNSKIFPKMDLITWYILAYKITVFH